MADENISSTSDIPFALMRHHAALALDIAGLSCENRLRLQQLDEQALADVVRLVRETAQNMRQTTDRSNMAALLNSLSSAHFHIAAQLWTHWLDAVANNQQALGAYMTKACSDWARDLGESMPGSQLGTDMDSYWANAYANFGRIFQTLNQTSEASTDNAPVKRRA